jgi:hypothetical protein
LFDSDRKLVKESNLLFKGGRPFVTPPVDRALFDEAGNRIDLSNKQFALFQFCDVEGKYCQRRVVTDQTGNPSGYVSMVFNERPKEFSRSLRPVTSFPKNLKLAEKKVVMGRSLVQFDPGQFRRRLDTTYAKRLELQTRHVTRRFDWSGVRRPSGDVHGALVMKIWRPEQREKVKKSIGFGPAGRFRRHWG